MINIKINKGANLLEISQAIAKKESEINWAQKTPELTVSERAKLYQKIGNDYMTSKKHH